jgi:opacity protein-like surface antigen
MKNRLTLVAALTAAIFSGVSIANASTQPVVQVPLSGVFVGAGVGSNWQTNTNYNVNLVAGYQYNRFLASEVTYDFTRLNNTRNRGAVGNGQMVMVNAVAGYTVPGTRLTPYALAGAGVGWNRMGDQSTGDNVALYNVGAGVRLAMSSNIDADVRYRYVGAFNDNLFGNSHLVTAGVRYRF